MFQNDRFWIKFVRVDWLLLGDEQMLEILLQKQFYS